MLSGGKGQNKAENLALWLNIINWKIPSIHGFFSECTKDVLYYIFHTCKNIGK